MDTTQGAARTIIVRRWAIPLGLLALLTLLVGCASPHVTRGDMYRTRGAPVTALAYYGLAVAEAPDNPEARAAWSLTYQRLARDHRAEIERLVSSAQARRALGRLARLEELALRGSELGVPADDPGGLSQERTELERVARQEISEALDQRMERGQLMWSDVVVCRQWAALAPRDPMGERCERLADRFRYYAAVRTARPLTPAVLRSLLADLHRRSTDRLQIVPEGDPRLNAILELRLETPVVEDRAWRIIERRSCRRWLPKTNKKGRPIVHTVKVPPTPQQVRAAKAAKQPVPAPRSIKKKVWVEVAGELRRSQRDRLVSLSWSVGLRDLRDQRMVSATGGRVQASAKNTRSESSGHPRACGAQAETGGPGLPSGDQLAKRAAGQIGEKIAAWALSRVD